MNLSAAELTEIRKQVLIMREELSKIRAMILQEIIWESLSHHKKFNPFLAGKNPCLPMH